MYIFKVQELYILNSLNLTTLSLNEIFNNISCTFYKLKTNNISLIHEYIKLAKTKFFRQIFDFLWSNCFCKYVCYHIIRINIF